MDAFSGLTGTAPGFSSHGACIRLRRMFAAATRREVEFRAPRAAATARANLGALLALLLLP